MVQEGRIGVGQRGEASIVAGRRSVWPVPESRINKPNISVEKSAMESNFALTLSDAAAAAAAAMDLSQSTSSNG